MNTCRGIFNVIEPTSDSRWMLQFPVQITGVKQRPSWIVHGLVTIEDSENVRPAFPPITGCVRLMWVAGGKSGELRVSPPSWYNLVFQSDVKHYRKNKINVMYYVMKLYYVPRGTIMLLEISIYFVRNSNVRSLLIELLFEIFSM